MASYSIRDLEKMTGIKAHTIRIWERRYNLIEPKRTPTNIRYYSDDDLKRLLNISILCQNGYKISKIALLDSHQLTDRVVDLSMDTNNHNIQIEALIVSMLDLDDRKFAEVLTKSIIKHGFETTVETILFPFLEKIGKLWLTGSIYPAQEHFISNLIRQKLIVAIDNEMTKYSKKRGPSIVFFMPEGENHELSLLFYSFIALKENFEVIYLGSSVPITDVEKILKIKPSNILFTSLITAVGNKNLCSIINQIKDLFPDKHLFATGLSVKESEELFESEFNIITSSTDFKQQLHTIIQNN